MVVLRRYQQTRKQYPFHEVLNKTPPGNTVVIPSRLNYTKDKPVKHVTLLGGLFCCCFALLWISTKIRTYSVSNILSSAPIPFRRVMPHEDKYIFRNIWKPWREGWSGHSSQGKVRMWHLQGCCLHGILWRGDRYSFWAFVAGRLKKQQEIPRRTLDLATSFLAR